MTSEAATSSPIDYAPAAPIRRRRRIRRALAAAILILIAVIAYRHGPGFWQRAKVRWTVYRAAAAYRADPSTITWDETQVDRAGYARATLSRTGDPGAVRPDPPELSALEAITMARGNFVALNGTGATPPGALVFLG